MNCTLKELITSFTKSVDLYNYLLKSHHRRTAVAAYRIGKEMGLESERLESLVIAAALHDIGALTIAERDQLIRMDVEDPFPHSSLGCYMLESFEPFYLISRIIYYHHWRYDEDNQSVPELGPVPLESYIIHVADRVDILVDPAQSILMQKGRIIDTINGYRNTLFHPQVVDAFSVQGAQDSFWLDINNLELEVVLESAITKKLQVDMNIELLEQFAFTLSKIIDSRSKFAISHSFGVSQVAYYLGGLMGYPEEKCKKLRIAGLLHDMGKIAISTEIIEKKGSLTETERTDIRTHAYFTTLILHHMEGLEEIVDWAASHHENHDGTGYPMNLVKDEISEEMDVVAYSDIFTALSEDRPYRKGMAQDEILVLLQEEFLPKHGKKVLEVIVNHIDEISGVCKEAVEDGKARFHLYKEMLESHYE